MFHLSVLCRLPAARPVHSLYSDKHWVATPRGNERGLKQHYVHYLVCVAQAQEATLGKEQTKAIEASNAALFVAQQPCSLCTSCVGFQADPLVPALCRYVDLSLIPAQTHLWLLRRLLHKCSVPRNVRVLPFLLCITAALIQALFPVHIMVMVMQVVCTPAHSSQRQEGVSMRRSSGI